LVSGIINVTLTRLKFAFAKNFFATLINLLVHYTRGTLKKIQLVQTTNFKPFHPFKGTLQCFPHGTISLSTNKKYLDKEPDAP